MSADKQILLVEDDQGICEMLTEFFTDEGYNVVYATTGQSALTFLTTKTPDLIILDLGLPDMSGNTVLSELAQRQLPATNTPALIVSANPGLAIKNPQIHSVIAKPFDLSNLLFTVQQII
jgi:DNA-binding response OmpR family regulator